MTSAALRSRSIRTLAWLGDAAFEREVRWRLAMRGDYPTEKLDASKAAVVRAEAQAAMLNAIEPELDDAERSIAQRGRNASLPSSARGRKNTKAYREATGFEALVAHWALGGHEGWQRFTSVVGQRLDDAIDNALRKTLDRPPRG